MQLVNEHDRNAMQHLNENYDKLSFHNRQWLDMKCVDMFSSRILFVLSSKIDHLSTWLTFRFTEKHNRLFVFDINDNEYEFNSSNFYSKKTLKEMYEIFLNRFYQTMQDFRFDITIDKDLKTIDVNWNVDVLIIYFIKHFRDVLIIHVVIRLYFQIA